MSMQSVSPSPALAPERETTVVDVAPLLGVRRPVPVPVELVDRGGQVEPAGGTCLVVRGAVLSRFLVGSRAAAQLLGPGDLLIADHDTAAGPIRCESRALVLSLVTAVDAGALVCQHPAAVSAMVGACTGALQALAEQHVVSQLVDLETRVASLLPRLAERWGVVSPHGILLPAFFTHAVLADLLGVRRPSFTTAAARLSAEGLLRRRRDGRWCLGSGLDRQVAAFVDGSRDGIGDRF